MSPDFQSARKSRAKPKTVAGVLSDDRLVLGPLIRRARHLERVNRTLRGLLDPGLAEHCRVANVDRYTLVLQTDSSAWASRLRYLAPAILEKLAKKLGWKEVTHTKVLVRPELPPDRQPSARTAHLSRESASLLRDVALSIEDPRLREALLKLSRRGS